ncbi:MAG: redoxin domain-containing protein [Verrucomicrobiia bacterium]
MKKILSFLVTLSLASLAQAIEVGKSAPEFSVKDCCGEEVKLSDYKGKTVVLEWTNPECPFVKKYYDGGHMQDLQKKYTDKGVIWLRINSSAPGKQGYLKDMEEAMELTKKQKAKATKLLLDSDGHVGKLYDAKTTPHMFVINTAGVLVYAGAIDNDPDTSYDPKAKNYVADALDAALTNKSVETANTQPYGCSVKY